MWPSDAVLRRSTRILTVAAITLFVGSLVMFARPGASAFLGFPVLLTAVVVATIAYVLTRLELRRHPVRRDLTAVRADEEEDATRDADAEAMYPVQVAGIPISIERRSRVARKKG